MGKEPQNQRAAIVASCALMLFLYKYGNRAARRVRRRKGGLQIAVAWKDDEGGGGAQGAPQEGRVADSSSLEI